MAQYVTKIRTENGDLPIDYLSLANLPTSDATLTKSGEFADAKVVGDKIKNINNNITQINDDITQINSDITQSNSEIKRVSDELKQINEDISGIGGGASSIGSILNDHLQSKATAEQDGHMLASDKKKLDGIEENANNYSLPTASPSTIGGVTTTSNINSTDGFEACPIINGVPYYFQPRAIDITLLANGWVDKQQVVNVSGVNMDTILVVSPNPSKENYTAYAESGIRCIEQGDNTLTFSCEDAPKVDIVVGVMTLT